MLLKEQSKEQDNAWNTRHNRNEQEIEAGSKQTKQTKQNKQTFKIKIETKLNKRGRDEGGREKERKRKRRERGEKEKKGSTSKGERTKVSQRGQPLTHLLERHSPWVQ